MLRDRAYYASYHALGWVSGLGALYLYLISRGRIPGVQVRSGEMALLLAGLVMLILTLPSAIMAWTEAEPPEDSGGNQMINRRSL
jgi:cytochrome c oxidase assembly factor CtaG